MKYFLPQQQRKGNVLLHFRWVTEQFYFVYSFVYTSNNKNGKYGCIPL